MLFGTLAAEKAQRVIPSILAALVPPAIEAKKQREKEAEEKRKEQLAQKAKEEQEKKEREAKEAKEREEREAAEREAEAAAAAAAAAAVAAAEAENQETAEASEAGEDQGMEGVESTEPSGDGEASTSEQAERVTIRVRDREVDITNLGIDLEYLEALPEDLREEVLMSQIQEQRAQAASSGTQPTAIDNEFLDALPPDIREEIVQQEAADRRRREREEARRRTAEQGGGAPRAEDMDPASFLASLDPQLRQAVLLDQDEEMLAALGPEITLEARQLGNNGIRQYMGGIRGGVPRARSRPQGDEEVGQKKPKPRPIPQLFDKPAIAALLRLMFIPQQGTLKANLNAILLNACENRQNRAEVLSGLLSILQDGSGDVNAIERSFAHLSIKAKQSATQKTPQPSNRSSTGASQMPDVSPLMVVQQCLNTLGYLAAYNKDIAQFFLTEHEISGGFRSRVSKKGKGKETRANKFPLNALLSLLDRKIVFDSLPVMEQMASLLQMITLPLHNLLKKEKEKSDNDGKEKAVPESEGTENAQPSGDAVTTTTDTATETDAATATATATATDPVATTDAVTTADTTTTIDAPEQAEATTASGADTTATTAAEGSSKPQEVPKKSRIFDPPEVPEANLRLVVNILAARECNSKTYQNTVSVITNLSAIPEAKETFGRELMERAQELGSSVLRDLGELSTHISKAKTGTEVQGLALSKFSPSSSDQLKLLRVITALDYLFDPKRASATNDNPASRDVEGLDKEQKQDILTTLYQNTTFDSLWTTLSECLTIIRERGNMFNVATILLPLIEVLMIVCKNTGVEDPAVPLSQPASRIAKLFFTFTEDHRKILNDLVRHNPRLMRGSFSVLVKNSKVLEFDNKRNYFYSKLKDRSTDMRHPHPPLQLSIRREQVFLDSFKSLYYKSPDEMKYGKLSIRFHGEEGVDAGGVTREWYQALAKQMFNPDYALFNPVAADRTTFHPNPLSSINQEHLTFFKFIGRIIGKALFEGRALDCHFSRAVYKRILGNSVGMKDMESLDLEYYKSLQWMLENDITDILTEHFSYESDNFGEVKVVDLKPNGSDIPVTEENKHEYVNLIVESKLIGSVAEQMENFLKGMHISAFLLAL